jgi:phage terminase large subunit GpA-like protein
MLVVNPDRLALEVLRDVMTPPPPVDLLAWAQANIVFDSGMFPGPYNPTLFPYFSEILRALGPDGPRHVTLMGSAQIGKTVCGEIFIMATLMLARGVVLVAHPSLENATRWSKTKLSPLMRSIPSVRENFPARTKDSLESILFKERRDGGSQLLITGANSPASLSMITVSAQVHDDLAKWEVNNVGDPEAMAESRSRAIADAKIFKISTPLIEPGCRISRAFRDGSQEMPFVPCPHCGEMQILEWDNFAANIDPANPDGACFTCVACGATIEEHERLQMLSGFEWRPTNPQAMTAHRSFWIWSAYSFLQSWPQIAREWLKAKGDAGAEQVFHNDTLGRPFETRGDGRPWEELAARAAKSTYTRGTVPPGCLRLFCGIDCQGDRVEWVVLGYGAHYKPYIVDFGTIQKFVSEPDCQHNIGQLLGKTWPNTFGRELGLSLTAIDANFGTDEVIAFARKYSTSKLICVRGVPGDATPRITKVQRERDEKRGMPLHYRNQFFNLGIYSLKTSLYRDLMKDNPDESGYIAFPRDLPDRFFQELVAEQRVAHKRGPQIIYRWEKPARQANEIHDCVIYGSAAALKYGVAGISEQRWRELSDELEMKVRRPDPSNRASAAARRLPS